MCLLAGVMIRLLDSSMVREEGVADAATEQHACQTYDSDREHW